MSNPNMPGSGEETGESNFDMSGVESFEEHMEEISQKDGADKVETEEVKADTFAEQPEKYKEMHPDAVEDVEQARVEAIAGDADETKAAHHLNMAEAELLDNEDAMAEAEDKLMEDYYHGGKTAEDVVKKDLGTNVDESLERAEDRQKAADQVEAEAAERYQRLQELRKR